MQTSRSWHDIRKDLQASNSESSQSEQSSNQETPQQQAWHEIRRRLKSGADASQPEAAADSDDPKAASPDAGKPFSQSIGEVKRVLLIVAFFSFVINVLMLVGPIYMMQVYDRVLTSGSMPTLIYLTLAAGGLILIGALLEGTRSRVLVRLGGRIDEMFSAQLFARLAERGASPRNVNNASLRDLDTLRGFLTGAGLFFFFDAPFTPLFLAVILLLHPWLFLVALAGAVMLFALALASEFVTRRPLAEAGVHMAAAAEFAANASVNADTVEAMGMMAGLRKRWQLRYRNGLALQSHASDRAGMLTAITKFIRPMLQIAILGVGAYLVLDQKISGGAMIAASIMMGRALAPVEGAIGNWRSFVLARAAYTRIRNLLSSSPSKISALELPRPEGRISVEKLVGSPPGLEKPVIDNVSFRLGAGEALGIVGPSASGKSTLAKLMIGVWAPTDGCARLDGASVADWDRAELGPHIGYLSQNIELFDGTVAENIARFDAVDAESIIAAAKDAGVHDLILRMPDGYATRVGRGGVTLSGGQRQRIGLARAIYGNPALVVLDEPNSNLDGQGEAALLQALQSLKRRGVTLVVIAHRASVLEGVDKILVLRDGKVDQFGERDEVLQQLARGIPRPVPPRETLTQQVAGDERQLARPEERSA